MVFYFMEAFLNASSLLWKNFSFLRLKNYLQNRQQSDIHLLRQFFFNKKISSYLVPRCPPLLERFQFYLSSFRHMSILTEGPVLQNSLLIVAIFLFFSYPIKTSSLNIILPFILCLLTYERNLKLFWNPADITVLSSIFKSDSH